MCGTCCAETYKMFDNHVVLVVLMVGGLVGTYAETADEFKDDILTIHNDYRRMQNGTNTNKLVWSDKLAKHADKWISGCNFDHEMKGFGENLFYATGTDIKKNLKTAHEDWYNEIKTYNYNSKGCGSSCHFTQMVWYSTREVGCAMKRCPSLRTSWSAVQNAWYFACWYSPMGNDALKKPYYTKGEPCSGCLKGQQCENRLCTGEPEPGAEEDVQANEPCEDSNDDCLMWADNGECDSNPKFMKPTCRKSCGVCKGAARKCEDQNVNCPQWAPTCKTNPSYMNHNCRKTCGVC